MNLHIKKKLDAFVLRQRLYSATIVGETVVLFSAGFLLLAIFEPVTAATLADERKQQLMFISFLARENGEVYWNGEV